MRKISVRPANEVEINFIDKTFLATFNMVAMRHMMEALSKKNEGLEEIPVEEFGAIILYSGIKVNEPDFTIEEANALALSMNPADLQEVIRDYTESTTGIDTETEEAISKKVIAQILMRLAKSNSKK